jgi:hypothetical protein
VNLSDPTGHYSQSYRYGGEGDFTGDLLYGIHFENGWTLENMLYVIEGARQVGQKLSEILGGSSSQAFRQAYGTSSTDRITFQWGNCPECKGAGGYTYGAHKIAFVSMAANWREDYQLRRINNVIHELGHAFRWRMLNVTGKKIDPYAVLKDKQTYDETFPDRIAGVEGYFGFASKKGPWQQSSEASENEEFADMFIGWTASTWEGGLFGWTFDGRRRDQFMTGNMPGWLFIVADAQYVH